MKILFDHNSRSYPLDLAQNGKTVTVSIDGRSRQVEVLRAGDGWLDIRLAACGVDPESVFRAHVSSEGANCWVTVAGGTFLLVKSTGASRRGGHAQHAAGELVSPMPGQVRAVQAAEGDRVVKGQTLMVVEAMKMEIKVAAPLAGRVARILVQPGQAVEKDQLLAELDTNPDAPLTTL
jgi:biotin carboxyl carrier protein